MWRGGIERSLLYERCGFKSYSSHIFFLFLPLFLQSTFHCNMRLIQFNVYFNDYMHTFIIDYIHYTVRVRARKITKFVAYLTCVRTVNNTVPGVKLTTL